MVHVFGKKFYNTSLSSRNSLNAMNVNDINGQEVLQKSASIVIHHNKTFANIAQDDCIFGQAAASPVDIQVWYTKSCISKVKCIYLLFV